MRGARKMQSRKTLTQLSFSRFGYGMYQRSGGLNTIEVTRVVFGSFQRGLYNMQLFFKNKRRVTPERQLKRRGQEERNPELNMRNAARNYLN